MYKRKCSIRLHHSNDELLYTWFRNTISAISLVHRIYDKTLSKSWDLLKTQVLVIYWDVTYAKNWFYMQFNWVEWVLVNNLDYLVITPLVKVNGIVSSSCCATQSYLQMDRFWIPLQRDYNRRLEQDKP